mgnify:CR=1 FL=1
MSTEKQRPTCPVCQSLMIPYILGMPSAPPTNDGGPDDFYMMGCLLETGHTGPDWGCRICEIQKHEEDMGPKWIDDADEI